MARRSLGNTNVSSLVKSSMAAYAKQQEYNDSVRAYEYELSQKTPEDYKAYVSYLKDRQSKTTDPSKVLTFTKTMDSAYKSHRSSEIQRANLAINYGTGSLYDKRALLEKQFAEAVAIGDNSLAQTIELQRSNVDIQITNQQQAAASRATAASEKAAGQKAQSYTEAIQDIERSMKGIGNALKLNDTVSIPVLDANGHPTGEMETTRVNSNNINQLMRNAIMTKQSMLEDAIKTTGDPKGEWDDKLQELKVSSDYMKYHANGEFDMNAMGMGRTAMRWNNDKKEYEPKGVRAAGPSQELKDKNGNTVYKLDSNGNPTLIPETVEQATLGFDGKAKNGSNQTDTGQTLTWVRKDDQGHKYYEQAAISTDAAGVPMVSFMDKGHYVSMYVTSKKRANGEEYIDFSDKADPHNANLTSKAGIASHLNALMQDGSHTVGEAVKAVQGAPGAIANGWGQAAKATQNVEKGIGNSIAHGWQQAATATQNAEHQFVDGWDHSFLGEGMKHVLDGDVAHQVGNFLTHPAMLKPVLNAIPGGKGVMNEVNGLGQGLSGIMGAFNDTRLANERAAEQQRQQAILDAHNRQIAAAQGQALAKQMQAITAKGAPGVPVALQPTPQQKAQSFVKQMNQPSSGPGNLPVNNYIKLAMASPSPKPQPSLISKIVKPITNLFHW